jgi:UDP-N-acetylmuramoyl-tripeptide--D-alanyl-D-alanine ligase
MTILVLLCVLVAVVLAGWRIGQRVRYFLHTFQLEGYKPNEYRAWTSARAGSHVWRLSHTLGLLVIVLAAVALWAGAGGWVVAVALLLYGVAFFSARLYRAAKVKKPLAWTDRMKRLCIAATAWTLVPVLIGLLVGWGIGFGAESRFAGWIAVLAGLWAADLGGPFWVLLAGYTTQPVERGVQEGFKRQARAKLASRPDLQILGITGSYGKTSVKFIIAELLRQKYNVLATPGSYNTPMGLCLVINTKLKTEHQILVLEMGMRYAGDIEELCEIAQPQKAVVTSVGVAHLETMGSIEATEREKASIFDHMTPGGDAILNGDDERVARMKGVSGRQWKVSLEDESADIYGYDVRYGKDGVHLTVRDDTGETADVHARLLGHHNILNLLLGVAVARSYGLRLRQIAAAASRIEPTEHRLALREENGLTVIDDAFNSNPVGARNAVEILGQMDGQRVIVTPGMVELGERQYEENKQFGAHIARHADLAILVGEEQTRPIQDGLREAGYPEDRIVIARNLYHARDVLRERTRPGDTVLYENDLPDQYGG